MVYLTINAVGPTDCLVKIEESIIEACQLHFRPVKNGILQVVTWGTPEGHGCIHRYRSSAT